jgi:alpha/beta superfamily hydrolase
MVIRDSMPRQRGPFFPDERVSFDSEGVALEGALTTPNPDTIGKAGFDMDRIPGLVVCHPHPLYGGTMDNTVVTAISEACAKSGRRCLRFNFRGVGGSRGAHGDGKGEVVDVLSALGYLRGLKRSGRVDLAGYSFGAMMALKAALKDKEVGRLACVALPVDYYEEVDLDPRPELEVLLVCGERDDIAQPSSIRKVLERLGDRGSFELVPGADHFFGGRTDAVGELVAEFLSGRS